VDNRGGFGRQLQIAVTSGTWQGGGQGVTGPCKAAWGCWVWPRSRPG
jgi:hypothetical protein